MVVMFGDMSQLGDALQSLELHLNLPSHTVCSQNIGRRPAAASCKYDHVFCKFECPRPSDHLLLTRLALQSPMSVLNRAVALSDCTQPARKLGAATMQDNPPFAKLSHLGQRSQSRKERDTSATYRVRDETLRVDANQHISALLPNILNPGDRAVPGIRENKFLRSHG